MESRTVTWDEIGQYVSLKRKERDWKQFALAAEAQVAERTIQRLERGKKVQEDTLKRVGQALGIGEDTLLHAANTQMPIPTLEECGAAMADFDRDYQTVELRPLETLQDTDRLLEAEMWRFSMNDIPDTLAESLASLEESYEDWSQSYSEMSPTQKLEATKEVLASVRKLSAEGCATRFGICNVEGLVLGLVVFSRGHDYRFTFAPKRLDLALRGKFCPFPLQHQSAVG